MQNVSPTIALPPPSCFLAATFVDHRLLVQDCAWTGKEPAGQIKQLVLGSVSQGIASQV